MNGLQSHGVNGLQSYGVNGLQLHGVNGLQSYGMNGLSTDPFTLRVSRRHRCNNSAMILVILFSLKITWS